MVLVCFGIVLVFFWYGFDMFWYGFDIVWYGFGMVLVLLLYLFLKLVMLPPVARAAALQVLALICEVRPDSLASFLDLSHSTHIVPT